MRGAAPAGSRVPSELLVKKRPENRKVFLTNLELNPDVCSSFEAASGEPLLDILSRSSVSRYSPISIAISIFAICFNAWKILENFLSFFGISGGKRMNKPTF